MASNISFGRKNSKKYWQLFAVILLLLCICLVIALAIVGSMLAEERSLRNCGEQQRNPVVEGTQPQSIFSDLTKEELESVSSYLFDQTDLNLVESSKATLNSSYIQLIEVHLPTKTAALGHLDNNGPIPKRWAKAVIVRGDIPNPEVQEYRVGPLPNPTEHVLLDYSGKRPNPVPFAYRAPDRVDYTILFNALGPQFFFKAGVVDLMYESFGIKVLECGANCFTFSPVPVSTSNSGNLTRDFWIGFEYLLPLTTLFPMELQILVHINGADIQNVRASKVWYNHQVFENVDEFLLGYSNGSVSKLRRTFPTEEESTFGRMDIRGDILDDEMLRPPRQIEPDGKRYKVTNQLVSYLGWSFYYRMSTQLGPMLFDVKYRGNRIAYEISLQEIVVFYSGNDPLRRFSDFLDSFNFIGYGSKALVPGADCPEHATFLSSTHFTSWADMPQLFEKSFCVFEQNTGMPLRRHHSADARGGWFYNGMMDIVLIFRTIATIGNYDYIIDFVFHQNGVVDVKAVSTGYIVSSIYSSSYRNLGFQLMKFNLGNIHHHMFNFKVDLDIKGTKNRFETFDITVEDADNSQWTNNPNAQTYSQITFQRDLKQTETAAAYKYDFNKPKYLIFYNENSTDAHGNKRSYRIAIHGMSKQTLPENRGAEPSISWSRYQMAVTKYHPDEMTSSSIYAQMDAINPVVNFQSYLDNNETIVDEDLVAWVTLGVHHIPRTEDLPVTTTPGGHLSFSLMPFNYFPEDPSMASRSAIRIENNPGNETDQVLINRYGLSPELTCFPDTSSDYDESITADRSQLFYS